VASDVSRAVTSILDTERVIQQVTSMVLDSFDFYHVGLYLLDASGNWAEYRAGSGAAGDAIREEGLRIEVGERSLVGWSVAHGQTRVASDVSQETIRMAHPLLPDTRSEVALPLVARGEVIGALNVQSDQVDAFDDDILNVLETIADQVALALDNARLMEESQTSLEAMRQLYGEMSQEAWARLAREQGGLSYRSDTQTPVLAIPSDWQVESSPVLRPGSVEAQDALLTVPIRFRDRVLGVLKFRKPDGAGPWTEEQIALAETLAERLSQALESARLYQESQRRAVRERLIRDVTANIRQTLDMEAVLKTGLDEIYQALDLEQVVVRLTAEGSE
jgi:GAF domain-containing protein